jgi:hypothetical protein
VVFSIIGLRSLQAATACATFAQRYPQVDGGRRSRQKSIFRREPQLTVRELIGQRLRREASVSARPVAEPG